MSSSSDIDPFASHDHGKCRKAVLADVAEECRVGKLRLTPARACVLEALLEEHKAMTAYELLDRLRDAGFGNQPPVVYRALDALIKHGVVHKIERLSAFVACTHGRDAHSAAFFLCRSCKRVSEAALPALVTAMTTAADKQNFEAERMVMEVEGLCAACREAGQ